jgi:hypothetical protein
MAPRILAAILLRYRQCQNAEDVHFSLIFVCYPGALAKGAGGLGKGVRGR